MKSGWRYTQTTASHTTKGNPMKCRVLILIEGSGASGPLYIQAAQHLGLHPITLSADPDQHDYIAAEGLEPIRVDTDNLEALIHVISQLREIYDIAGITSDREAFYATAAKLCRYFGLPGPNPAPIDRCCDKFTQRRLLAGAGIPIPDYRLAANAAEIESAAAEIGLPVVLKPVVGVGSTGVLLCRTVDELAKHTTYLLGGKHTWRSSPRVLVEEFAQGPYYNVDTMGNEVVSIGTGDIDSPPHFVFREDTVPAALTDDERARIEDVSLSCLQTLDLGWGPANIELRWTERGPVVIEVNPRLGAGSQLVQLAYGVDLVTEHIKLVIGEKCDLRRKHSHTAIWRNLIPDRDGILDWISGDIQAGAIPGIAEVKLDVKPKAPIVRQGDYRDCMGYVIASSPNPAQAKAILQRAVDLIRWSITPSPTLGERQQSVATHLPPLGRVVPGKK